MISIPNKKVTLGIGTLIFLFDVILYVFATSELIVFGKLYASYLIISSFILLFLAYKNKADSVVLLVLSFFIIFYYGRLFSYLFVDSHLVFWLGGMIKLESNTIITVLSITKLSFNILWALLVFPIRSQKIYKNNSDFEKIGKIIFISMFPFALYNFVNELIVIKQQGLLAFYTGSYRSGNLLSSILTLSSDLLDIGYFLIVASIPKKKTFKIFSYLFLFIMVFNSLKGIRGLFILPMMYYLWYNSRVYNIKILNKTNVLIFIGLFIFVQYLGASRFDNEANYGIFDFTDSQGVTLNVTGFYFENAQSFKEDGYDFFVFAPVKFPYLYFKYRDDVVGQKPSSLKLRGDLNHSVTYKYNENYYLAGAGLGSSYIAELYEFGLLFVIIGSIFLGLFIRWFVGNLHKPIIMYFSYIVLTHLFIIARNSYFPNFWIILKYLIGYIFIIQFIKIIKR